MTTFNPRLPSRRVVLSTAAALFAGVALIAIPKVASYPGRNAPRVTETAPARHNPSLRQGLPFSASEVEAYFTEALGTPPRRERNTATFSNPPGEPMENTFAISIKTEESGVAVSFTGRGDYAMNLAREFFEAPFFNRDESVRFYAMLTHPNVDQTAPLARFTVHFRVVDHPDDFHLSLHFNPCSTMKTFEPIDIRASGESSPTLDYIQQTLRLKTLLVPTDFSTCSQKAIHYAEELARQFGSTIVLLHVVEPVHPYPADGLAGFPGEHRDLNLELLPEAEESMEKLAALVGRTVETPVRHVTRVGSAHEEIVRLAEEQDVDLIVISTHGRTGLKRFFMGSTAEVVVRHAPCPVFVVREKEHDFA